MNRLQTAVALIAGVLFSTSPLSVHAKGDPAKGQGLAGACAACHGPDGNSMIPTNPSLAQQHPEYITKQLKDFKKGNDGERPNAIMAGMAAGLTPEAMEDVAAYFGKQKLRHAGARDRELVTAGRKLYRGGDSARGIPACSACHSPTGAGIPSQYPRVGGQHVDYTVAQLKAFRAGERKNDPNQMMRSVAAKLTDKDITALAEYLAGLK